jgi:hypothetical protein
MYGMCNAHLSRRNKDNHRWLMTSMQPLLAILFDCDGKNYSVSGLKEQLQTKNWAYIQMKGSAIHAKINIAEV